MNKEHEAAKAATKKRDGLNPSTTNTNDAVDPVKAPSNQTPEVDESKPLNKDQKKLLTECVDDIIANQREFFVVGYRLWQIRSQKLHRETHKSYEAFCDEKFDFSKSHANRLIDAYHCEKQLKAVKDVEVYVPTKESQVRWIADLDEEEQVEVAELVAEMVGEKHATAEDFKTAREKLYPKPKREAKAAPTIELVAVEPAKPSVVELMKFDTNLVSLSKLRSISVEAYNMYSDSSRHKELEKLLWKLKEELKDWEVWEKRQVDQKEVV